MKKITFKNRDTGKLECIVIDDKGFKIFHVTNCDSEEQVVESIDALIEERARVEELESQKQHLPTLQESVVKAEEERNGQEDDVVGT